MTNPVGFRRIVAHREYTMYGANAEIFACLESLGILDQILPAHLNAEQILIRALASPSYPERILCGKECIKEIWKVFVPFGPFTLLDRLAEFEFDREFYTGYRDHVTHQLKVALLGLYAYETCTELRSLIDRTYGGRHEFQRRWIMASLAHDLGYVFEVGDAANHNHAQRIVASLNQFLENPLREFVEWRLGSVLLPAQYEDILQILQIRSHTINCFDDLRRASDGTDLFSRIENHVRETRLSNSPNPLQSYLRYARSNNPPNQKRRGFIDHGIASGYLLLNLFDACCSWSSFLPKAEAALSADIDIYQKLLTYAEDFKAVEEAVNDAAVAVSLHNIWPEIWELNHAYRWEDSKLTLNRFKIPFQVLPLAAMLSIIDKVQEWDRPKFSAPTGKYDWPADVQSQDLHILPFEAGLGLAYPADILGCTGDSQSRFSQLMNEIATVVDGWQDIFPLREISSTDAPSILRQISWGESLLNLSSDAQTSCLPPAIESKDSNVTAAFHLYREGRSLANNGAWLAASECHQLSADKFLVEGMDAWAARSLGRVAFNELDLRATGKAQDFLDRAYTLDRWQGTANYYWVVEHCARGSADSTIAETSLERMLRGIAGLPNLEREWLVLSSASQAQLVPLYEQCLISFFEGLVTQEVSAGWPSWAMSDAGRLYVLRAEASRDVDDILLESAARAYEDAELSSYAAWYRTKAQILRSTRTSDIAKVTESLTVAQECIRGVIQRPGGKSDAATLANTIISSACSLLKYLQTSEKAYLSAAETVLIDSKPLGFDNPLDQYCELVKQIGANGTEFVNSDETPRILRELQELLMNLAFYETRLSGRLIEECLPTAITLMQNVSRPSRPFDA